MIPGDKQIILNWDKTSNEAQFNSYILERSEDGGSNWVSLTEQPLVFIESDREPINVFSFADSVGVNNKKFKYRLSGYTSYAELSPTAEVEGEAVDLTPPDEPLLNYGEYFKEENKIVIRWEMSNIPNDFAGFQVLHGSSPESKYHALNEKLVRKQG